MAIVSSEAALIVSYTTGLVGDGLTAPASDWHDDLNTPSHMTPHGSISKAGFNQLAWTGFTMSHNLTDYVGFGLSIPEGKQFELTSLNFNFALSGPGFPAVQRLDGIAWGYRIDNGSGYGSWNLSSVYSSSSSSAVVAEWIFDQPIVTTGSVEFALFGMGATTGTANNRSVLFSGSPSVAVNGNINAVPEPSAALLVSLCGLAGFFRRKR